MTMQTFKRTYIVDIFCFFKKTTLEEISDSSDAIDFTVEERTLGKVPTVVLNVSR